MIMYRVWFDVDLGEVLAMPEVEFLANEELSDAVTNRVDFALKTIQASGVLDAIRLYLR